MSTGACAGAAHLYGCVLTAGVSTSPGKPKHCLQLELLLFLFILMNWRRFISFVCHSVAFFVGFCFVFFEREGGCRRDRQSCSRC